MSFNFYINTNGKLVTDGIVTVVPAASVVSGITALSAYAGTAESTLSGYTGEVTSGALNGTLTFCNGILVANTNS